MDMRRLAVVNGGLVRLLLRAAGSPFPAETLGGTLTASTSRSARAAGTETLEMADGLLLDLDASGWVVGSPTPAQFFG